jgi:hypothetical protein
MNKKIEARKSVTGTELPGWNWLISMIDPAIWCPSPISV